MTKKLLEGEDPEMQALKVRFYKLMIEYRSLSGEKVRRKKGRWRWGLRSFVCLPSCIYAFYIV